MCYRKMDESKAERNMQFVVGLDISTCNHQLFRPNEYLQDFMSKLANESAGDGRISGARGCSSLDGRA